MVQQLDSHVRIRGRGQRDAAFGSRQAAGPLDQSHSAGAETHNDHRGASVVPRAGSSTDICSSRLWLWAMIAESSQI